MAQKTTTGSKMGIALGLATVGAVGAYLLYGTKEGNKKRKQISSWMLRAKADLMDELESAGSVTKETYTKAVDKIAAKYEKMKDLPVSEVVAFATGLRGSWKKIQAVLTDTKEATPRKRTSRRAAATA